MPDEELLDESGVPEEDTSVPAESEQEQEPSSENSTEEVETTTIDEEDSSEDEESASDLEDDVEDSTEESDDVVLVDETADEETVDEETVDEETTEELEDTGLWYFGHKVYFNSKGYPYYIDEDGHKVYITDTENITDSEEFTETEPESSEEICTDLEEFLESTVVVDRYQYTILERLEFIQYALVIEIALLFLILFMRYKK